MSTTLQHALAQCCEELARPRPAYPLLNLFTRSLLFGPAFRWDSPAPLPVRDAKSIELLPYGETRIGPALREVTREIDRRGLADHELPPIIVLFSDGLPTDSYRDALDDFDKVCTASRAIRLSVCIGRIGAEEFCREFLGDSRFDRLTAPTAAILSRVVREIGSSVIPAFLSIACGGQAAIPLEPARWVPHLFAGAIRGKRLSSQLFHALGGSQVSDRLSAAVIADLSLASPGDEIGHAGIDSVLSALLARSPGLLDLAAISNGAVPEADAIVDARSRLRGEGIRRSKLSMVLSEGDRVTVLAAQPLAISIASGSAAKTASVGRSAAAAPPGAPDAQTTMESRSFEMMRPAVVLVGTESLRNAFGSEEDFGAVAADLLRLSAENEGPLKAAESFSLWLQKAATAGGEPVAGIAIVFGEQPGP